MDSPLLRRKIWSNGYVVMWLCIKSLVRLEMLTRLLNHVGHNILELRLETQNT